MTAPTAFLCDVDNTLLDNDRFEDDLRAFLRREVGPDGAGIYWQALEALRGRLGYVDYLGAVQQVFDASARDPRWLGLGEYLLDYPFARRLFPGALRVLAELSALGPVWLVSDGDAVMQPLKLRRAGLWDAVAGRVRIYIHKETMLGRIARDIPAAHHVLIDDKPRILSAVKEAWGEKVTTIMPRQGHYAHESAPGDMAVRPDLVIDHIGDLVADKRFPELVVAVVHGKETS